MIRILHSIGYDKNGENQRSYLPLKCFKQVEELRQEKLEIDQQLRTIYGPDRGEYREDYRGVGRDHRSSYDNETYHRQSHDYRDTYHSGSGTNRRDHLDGGYQRGTGQSHIGGYRDQGKCVLLKN